MEVPGCISLFPQFFVHLFSTYTNMPHLPFSNQSFSSFFQLVSFVSSLVIPVYIFIHFMHHYLYQNISLRLSQNMIIPLHTICCGQLIGCFFQSQHVHQLHCIPLVHQLYTSHIPHHRFYWSLKNSYFIFSQTPQFTYT